MAVLAKDRRQLQRWALALVGGRAFDDSGRGRISKKGVEKGVDGFVDFIDDREKPNRGLVQVKCGNVEAGDIRDLRDTIKDEHTSMGAFKTPEPARVQLEKEALSAGSCHSVDWGRDFRKIQILTIADLLHGKKQVKLSGTKTTFKQVPKVNSSEVKQGELGS